MGEFAIFQRIVVLVATIATARYELALPLPKQDKDAFYLFRFSLKLTVITTLATSVCAIIYGILNDSKIEFYLVDDCRGDLCFCVGFFQFRDKLGHSDKIF